MFLEFCCYFADKKLHENKTNHPKDFTLHLKKKKPWALIAQFTAPILQLHNTTRSLSFLSLPRRHIRQSTAVCFSTQPLWDTLHCFRDLWQMRGNCIPFHEDEKWAEEAVVSREEVRCRLVCFLFSRQCNSTLKWKSSFIDRKGKYVCTYRSMFVFCVRNQCRR